MKCQILFSGGKYITSLSSAEFAQRVVKVNILPDTLTTRLALYYVCDCAILFFIYKAILIMTASQQSRVFDVIGKLIISQLCQKYNELRSMQNSCQLISKGIYRYKICRPNFISLIEIAV